MKPEEALFALWEALRRRHTHRRVTTRINRHGDITRTCHDCGDTLEIENPAANR